MKRDQKLSACFLARLSWRLTHDLTPPPALDETMPATPAMLAHPTVAIVVTEAVVLTTGAAMDRLDLDQARQMRPEWFAQGEPYVTLEKILVRCGEVISGCADTPDAALAWKSRGGEVLEECRTLLDREAGWLNGQYGVEPDERLPRVMRALRREIQS